MRLTIDNPIPEGAKTCEGCPHWRHNWYPFCALIRDKDGDHTMLTGNPPTRLPECLAAERVMVCEWWVLKDAQNHVVSPMGTKERTIERHRVRPSTRIVHVTRWRRAK